MLTPILIAIGVVTAIGLLCAVILAVASKIFEVKTNPKTTQIRACLPGANCGACGYAGCDGYANALAEELETSTTLCTPGAAKVAADIADILGVAASEVTKKVHARTQVKRPNTKVPKAVLLLSEFMAVMDAVYMVVLVLVIA